VGRADGEVPPSKTEDVTEGDRPSVFSEWPPGDLEWSRETGEVASPELRWNIRRTAFSLPEFGEVSSSAKGVVLPCAAMSLSCA
jgi:hypothetical protein